MGIMGLMVCGTMSAQTNMITFTNRSHEVISNAIVLRCDGVKLVYRTEGAGGGSVKLAELPRDLQVRFGYDPDRSAAAERKDSERLAADRKVTQALSTRQAALQAKQKRRAEVSKSETMVFGRVIQCLDNGLLVNADSNVHGERMSEEPAFYQPDLNREVPYAKGTVMLQDYKGKAVDGDMVNVLAYPVEYYEYTAVSGGRRRVRKYTANIDNCIPASEVKTMLQQIGRRPDSGSK